jgi:NADH-quinone oxidoreductase subunit N
LVALAQTNVKRMLAYTSIAHAGYLLVGMTALIATGQFVSIIDFDKVTALSLETAKPILFYLVAYTFMTLGAFGVIVVLGLEKRSASDLADFAGLGQRRPLLAMIMALCLLSLAGFPPLIGFTAKFFLLKAALMNRLYILCLIAVLNAVVSAYCYWRVIAAMYMQPETEPLAFPGAGNASGAMIINVLMAVLIVMIGIFPDLVFNLLDKSLFY